MSTPDSERAEPLAARLTAVEELLTHVERTVQDLNEVIQQVQRRLDALQQAQHALTRDMGLLAGRVAESRPIDDDRPLHP
jgi:uncharacterized coiled-coil protein SlyX